MDLLRMSIKYPFIYYYFYFELDPFIVASTIFDFNLRPFYCTTIFDFNLRPFYYSTTFEKL